MAQKKSERLMNLTIMLLSAKRFVSRDEIRERIEGYRDLSDQNFDRTFERDKDELRARGVPIVTGSNSEFFADEIGYRINRSDYELPEIQFTEDETALLSLAAGVWQQASAADHAGNALLKLQAGGAGIDSSGEAIVRSEVSVDAAVFDPIWSALTERRQISFEYRGKPEKRVVQPWRLVMRSNIWYLLGYDIDRQGSRIFRLNRISSAVQLLEQVEYEIPDEQSLKEMVESIAPSSDFGEAVLAIRESRAPALRRRGERVDWPGELPDGFAAWRMKLPNNATSEIASFGSQVLVLEPAELRDRVIARLREVVSAHGGANEA